MRLLRTCAAFFWVKKKSVKPILAFNAVFVALAAVYTATVYIAPKTEEAALVFKAVAFTVFQLFVLAAGLYFTGGARPLTQFFSNFCKKKLVQGLLFSGLTLSVFTACRAVLRIGLQAENAAGTVLALAAMTLFFFYDFSLFWFVAVFSSDGAAFIPCVKRSAMLFFKYPFFTCVFFFASLFSVLLSCLTMFLFPGPAGIVLTICSAYKRLRTAA